MTPNSYWENGTKKNEVLEIDLPSLSHNYNALPQDNIVENQEEITIDGSTYAYKMECSETSNSFPGFSISTGNGDMPLVQWEVHMSNKSSTKIMLNPPEPPDGYSRIEGNLSNLEVEANKTNVYLFRANVQENTLTYYSPIKTLLDSIYPVGSIYTTTKTDFDPNISFGGTWTQVQAGKYLLSVDKDSEQVRQYKDAILPNHYHTGSGTVTGVWVDGSSWVDASSGEKKVNRNGSASFSFTTSNPKTNVSDISVGDVLRPPSYTVIFWERTA